jgi:hypothetical protein
MLSDGRMRHLLHRMGFRYQRHIRCIPYPNASKPEHPLLAILNLMRAERLEPVWTWKR